MKELASAGKDDRSYDRTDDNSRTSEAFRILRMNLQFAAVDCELRVILVTSCLAGEGKSTVAQHLAQSISRTGKNVMILDVNLINPSLHLCFGIPNQQGLSNLIMGEADFTVFTRLDAYPNLCVITSGPVSPNSSELLGSMRMRHLMDRLREEYDVIILDASPLLSVTDAVIASSLADGVLLVIQAGHTHAADMRRACDVLGAAHANLLGIVLNTARHRSRKEPAPPVRDRHELRVVRSSEASMLT